MNKCIDGHLSPRQQMAQLHQEIQHEGDVEDRDVQLTKKKHRKNGDQNSISLDSMVSFLL